MTIYNRKQQEIGEKIATETVLKNWKDWKWQLKHLVKDINSFEALLGITFDREEREPPPNLGYIPVVNYPLLSLFD